MVCCIAVGVNIVVGVPRRQRSRILLSHATPVMRVWPLGVVDQPVIPNRPELHLLRADVVSVREKAGVPLLGKNN